MAERFADWRHGAPAPLYAAVADGPDGGAALWLSADGTRIRLGVWHPPGAAGTVLLFPGRTEYVEKYGRAAADLAAMGLATVTVDWRGQGLAQRLPGMPQVGHVDRFRDYQRDVVAMVAQARAMDLPRPWFLIAHSMGGAIGLRALMEGLPVAAAVFTGPMWGIRIAPALRPLAWGLSTLSRPLGFDTRFAPGQDGSTYVIDSPFEGNGLTSDPEMFDWMRRQLLAHPELALGGPSLAWLNESLRELRSLAGRPAPRVPALTFLGTDEAIVEQEAIRQRMARWTGGELVTVPGGRHEVMMETPAIRQDVWTRAGAFLARHGG